MSIDLSPVVSELTDAGVAVGSVGGAVLLVVVAVKAFRYLGLTLDSAGSVGGKADRMETYKSLRSEGWSPSEIQSGGKYTGPGSVHYGP